MLGLCRKSVPDTTSMQFVFFGPQKLHQSRKQYLHRWESVTILQKWSLRLWTHLMKLFVTLPREWSAPPGKWWRTLCWESRDLSWWFLGHHLRWQLGPAWRQCGVQAAGLWYGCECHCVGLLWRRNRAYLVGRNELQWRRVPHLALRFTWLGETQLQA